MSPGGPERLRVLLVYKDFYPPVIGGIERHVHDLAVGLPSHGVHADVLVAARSTCTVCDDFDVPGNGFARVHVTHVGQWGRVLSAPVTPTFPRWLARLAPGYDLLHFHFPNPTAEISWLLAGGSTPALVTYHSDIVRQCAALAVYRPFLQRFLERMRRIVVPSPQLMRTSPILAAHGEKCAVVPFGVAAENFRLTPEIAKAAVALRERLVGDASRGVVFLFVGKFRYYKGLPVLLEAFRRLASRVPAARLLLVGDGPEKSALQAEASRSGLAHCVHFAGPLSDGELVACYHACDVLVLPSVKRSEAFGLVLLEAMACGKPVVSTELGTATSWVNQTERTGLVVPPGDAAALEHALERLARNASLRAALGENAGARIRAHFQPKHMFDGICSQYELTCSVPSPARKQKQSVTTSVGELHR